MDWVSKESILITSRCTHYRLTSVPTSANFSKVCMSEYVMDLFSITSKLHTAGSMPSFSRLSVRRCNSSTLFRLTDWFWIWSSPWSLSLVNSSCVPWSPSWWLLYHLAGCLYIPSSGVHITYCQSSYLGSLLHRVDCVVAAHIVSLAI